MVGARVVGMTIWMPYRRFSITTIVIAHDKRWGRWAWATRKIAL